MITAEKLTFGFDSTLLFQNISFTLEEDCHCALIGSNGTGKTTLTELIREPERFSFDGRLRRDGVGRIGYVSQFALREGDQSVTVYDYLCRDFRDLEQAVGEACLEMETAEDMDALMERYQALLDESDAVDAVEISLEMPPQSGFDLLHKNPSVSEFLHKIYSRILVILQGFRGLFPFFRRDMMCLEFSNFVKI